MIEFEIKGIKCDNCDYRDDSVHFHDYPEYVDRPCPLCQHNLLTIKEYNDCLKQYTLVERLNRVGNVLKWINPLYYWRLIFGDNRRKTQVTVKFLNDKK